MAKVKNKKRISVDHIQKKRQKQSAPKPMNPFEIHINKEKMRVLGKSLKNDKGLPGISRAKAIQKRKHTLLSEYKLQHKSNKFMDKRIGERGKVPQEDKIMARFAAVRAKAHNRKSIFNLADDEILTHKGQTLSEIEKFDDPRSDNEDSEEENKTGKLESNFVEDAHFGGGILSNTGQEGAKTHKQLIEQLIEESKKRKAEKQKIKEATLELTEKLDTEWKDLIQLVSKNNKKEDHEEKPKLDDYDKTMRELKFEARGTVSDRLKTEDEVAKEEKEKLEKLEQERLDRMRGFTENNPIKPNHRSADDLEDDFMYEESDDDDKNMLTYDDEGQSNVQVRAELNGKAIGEGIEDIVLVEQLPEDIEQRSEKESEGEDEESDSEDSLADLKQGESSEESDVEMNDKISSKQKEENSKKFKSHALNEPCEMEKGKSNDLKTSEEAINKISESEQKELEKAGNELPFTFSLPESYEHFLETLQNRSVTHQKVILERMIKCNHPSLSQGNKASLGVLFAYTLQYINDLFTDIETAETLITNFQLLSSLMPHIFDLAQLNKENTHNSILEVIKEKHQDFRKKKKRYPSLEVLVFLKLVSLLFSTSDFRHQIVTPCFVFMEQMLTCCGVKSARSLAYGLFISTLALEFTSLSNRYLPASVNFLAGVLHMAIPKSGVKIIKVLPPFKSLSSDLVLVKKYSKDNINAKLHISSLVQDEFTDDFKVSALFLALQLLKEFQENLKNLPSNVEIFNTTEEYLRQIPMKFYPNSVRDAHQELCDSFDKMKSERKLEYLMMEVKKPKALRLYEPKIIEVYDGKRHKVQSKAKAERDKLQHKLKRETKGALREIRRDKAFLGRVKINQRIRSDKERRDKVNKIFAEAASQQSELNALDRKKKRKK